MGTLLFNIVLYMTLGKGRKNYKEVMCGLKGSLTDLSYAHHISLLAHSFLKLVYILESLSLAADLKINITKTKPLQIYMGLRNSDLLQTK